MAILPLRICRFDGTAVRSLQLPSVGNVAQWRIGTLGAAAEIEIDEPTVEGLGLCITWRSNHQFLHGMMPDTRKGPTIKIAIDYGEGWRLPYTPEYAWTWHNPFSARHVLRADGTFEVRLDQFPLRIEGHVLQVIF